MTVTAKDVRQLLRALGNPVALKRNALAELLVGRSGADPPALQERHHRILAILRASLSSMCSHAGTERSNERMRRAANIVERCDIAGDPHEAVANDAGLARRQFYRDRQLALESLALELDDVLRVQESSSLTLVDATHIGFDVAEALVGVGKFDEAEALLERIATSASPDDRVRACARSIEGACETEERGRTRRALARATEIISGIDASSFLARARFDLAVITANELICAPLSTNARAALLDRLRDMSEASDERWETLAIGLSARAVAANTRGDFSTALASLHEAEAVLRRCERVPLTLPALIPNYLGVTLMMLPQSLDAASEQHRRAASLGRARGLMRIVVASTLNDCAIALWRGHASTVCAQAMETLETARAVTSRGEFGRLVVLVAKIALGAGRLGDALRLIDEVKGVNDEYPQLRPRAILVEVEILLRAGDFKRAVEVAQAAIDATRASGESSLVGTALLLHAEALIGSDDRTLAARTLGDAIAALETTGSAHALSRARDLAAQLARRAASSCSVM